ncbi:glycosyl transferase family 2 [Motilibacter rhizosphaerae]|uniref:Glycosyl transferase family 2 n=1 Tax=Motilibacter rhizosphaerae TaxID=598652 RepID=A0A4Q7NQ03_9ACTN|nr:glycosyltransferase family 2 protein [Motilibacter rhizosphaerae]RZS87405.1 glycosyl transferase family 2 [Motilibacter rhizosphaerae]
MSGDRTSHGSATVPLLTLAIPTYNRAPQLDELLAHLVAELAPVDVAWELAVHDNASTDSTSEVVERWQRKVGEERFRYVRHQRNTGGIANLVSTLELARGTWVWTLGDDDVLHPGCVAEVIRIVQEQPDLALLFLNFCGRNGITGEMTKPHYFDTAAAGRTEDGRAAFMHQFAHDMGSVIFLTACIYRTDYAQQAVASWQGSLDNWALAAYLTGATAAHGPVLVTERNWVDCIEAVSSWMQQKGLWAKIQYHDVPVAMSALVGQGYPVEWCRRMGLHLLTRPLSPKALVRHVRAAYYYPRYLRALPRVLFLKEAS